MNLRPLDPQSSTLPAALHPDLQRSIKPCLNRIPNLEGKVKCFVKISAANLRHAACFERRRTVNPSETAYTLREPIANTAITIKTSNPSAAESAPDSRISTSHRRAMCSGRLSQSASKCAAGTVPSHSSESLTGRNAGVRVTQRESRKPVSTAITIAANTLSVRRYCQKHQFIH